jgi:3-oxoacyl-[acyl-carrier protein] reductase
MQDRTTSPDMLAAITRQIPLRRGSVADECVGTFLFLASDALSGDVTGQVIEVNGGLAMP